MKIKNFQNLAITDMRRKALEIIEAGLEAIDTKTVIEKNIRLENDILFIQEQKFSLEDKKRIFVIGAGKCSIDGARALEKVLGDRITAGIVIDIRDEKLGKIQVLKASHPFPKEENVFAVKKIIDLLSGLTEDDLVIAIISGGGSTLLCLPPSGNYEKEAELVKCLFKSGADIHELNTLRKHLSLARGGNLAKLAYPAKIISLIFSDVPGNNLEIIASGPTIKDTTTIKDAKAIMEKHQVKKQCGIEISEFIETPKDDKYFTNVSNILFLSNIAALEAMQRRANELGFDAKISTNKFTGEAEDLGKKITEDIKKTKSKTALIYGGESTVTVKIDGVGGRNQELALSALNFLDNGDLIISLASDGRDNSDIAGAICDEITKEKAKKLKLDINEYLRKNNSYYFFKETGDYIETGITGSNVSDLVLAIKN